MSTRNVFIEVAVAAGSGLLFGYGLVVSGMANPAKVLGFLDVFGSWDPSLALVMSSAVGIGLPGFRLIAGRTRSAFGLPMQMPKSSAVDRPLIFGAALFGVGWGLAGLCPGPAIASLSLGAHGTLDFVPAMLTGLAVATLLRRRAGPAQ